MQDSITVLIKELFEKLNISTNSLEVTPLNKINSYNINIQSDESELLIGFNGKTYDALQNIIQIMSSKKTGEKVRISLEINDYIKVKDDRLLNFIKKEIEYLKKSGKDIQLPYYSAYERKKIHSFIHKLKDDNIFSKSTGEGKERRLYLCKKIPKLTIDIDGCDI